MEYYLLVRNEKRGPFSIDELKEQPLTRTSLVWCKGMSDWEKLEDVEELKSIKENIPPTIPIMDLRKNKAPRNWLVESVVITSLLALPFGIIGIIESIRSEEAMKHGDYERAQLHSERAHQWVLWGSYAVILGFIIICIMVLFIMMYTHLI
ncbi:MAG: DUF4339 domain-containing protein [Bacteroidaceae bacterium]|nr:DUF4339 domain-containing protein [Bacteroidaceae bacterium]